MKAQELLTKYKAGQRDFRGVSLRGENLAWANLAHIDFRAANLQDVNLSGADLSDVTHGSLIFRKGHEIANGRIGVATLNQSVD
jgi:hypothetical protein